MEEQLTHLIMTDMAIRDRTLERYSYAPNFGPLTMISYGNGDVQDILYDKEGRIKSRRWNGQSTDAVRYEYDDYGTLEKETDLVNGRIDKDQYDMTGRLVQSTTLEKNTGAAGEPTVANTHTVQSLEIGYDSYNRVNRLVQSLEGSKTKTGLVYGDASKTQRPGLSYGLTVDGEVTRGTGKVAQNVSLLARYVSPVKKSESSRKELSGFFCVFIRMQSSRGKNKSL